MDEKSLSAFVALAEHLHFGQAAARCHMSPSALSRLIQRLEGYWDLEGVLAKL